MSSCRATRNVGVQAAWFGHPVPDLLSSPLCLLRALSSGLPSHGEQALLQCLAHLHTPSIPTELKSAACAAQQLLLL